MVSGGLERCRGIQVRCARNGIRAGRVVVDATVRGEVSEAEAQGEGQRSMWFWAVARIIETDYVVLVLNAVVRFHLQEGPRSRPLHGGYDQPNLKRLRA
jgi:hypothetical protein